MEFDAIKESIIRSEEKLKNLDDKFNNTNEVLKSINETLKKISEIQYRSEEKMIAIHQENIKFEKKIEILTNEINVLKLKVDRNEVITKKTSTVFFAMVVALFSAVIKLYFVK